GDEILSTLFDLNGPDGNTININNIKIRFNLKGAKDQGATYVEAFKIQDDPNNYVEVNFRYRHIVKGAYVFDSNKFYIPIKCVKNLTFAVDIT
ncbi:MAG TPA: hypothetical protein VF941_21575, partial [Clostridia bacterium]